MASEDNLLALLKEIRVVLVEECLPSLMGGTLSMALYNHLPKVSSILKSITLHAAEAILVMFSSEKLLASDFTAFDASSLTRFSESAWIKNSLSAATSRSDLHNMNSILLAREQANQTIPDWLLTSLHRADAKDTCLPGPILQSQGLKDMLRSMDTFKAMLPEEESFDFTHPPNPLPYTSKSYTKIAIEVLARAADLREQNEGKPESLNPFAQAKQGGGFNLRAIEATLKDASALDNHPNRKAVMSCIQNAYGLIADISLVGVVSFSLCEGLGFPNLSHTQAIHSERLRSLIRESKRLFGLNEGNEGRKASVVMEGLLEPASGFRITRSRYYRLMWDGHRRLASLIWYRTSNSSKIMGSMRIPEDVQVIPERGRPTGFMINSVGSRIVLRAPTENLQKQWMERISDYSVQSSCEPHKIPSENPSPKPTSKKPEVSPESSSRGNPTPSPRSQSSPKRQSRRAKKNIFGFGSGQGGGSVAGGRHVKVQFDSDKSLGMQLDGSLVTDIAPQSQADTNGVETGWRLDTVEGKRVNDDTAFDVLLSVITKKKSTNHPVVHVTFSEGIDDDRSITTLNRYSEDEDENTSVPALLISQGNIQDASNPVLDPTEEEKPSQPDSTTGWGWEWESVQVGCQSVLDWTNLTNQVIFELLSVLQILNKYAENQLKEREVKISRTSKLRVQTEADRDFREENVHLSSVLIKTVTREAKSALESLVEIQTDCLKTKAQSRSVIESMNLEPPEAANSSLMNSNSAGSVDIGTEFLDGVENPTLIDMIATLSRLISHTHLRNYLHDTDQCPFSSRTVNSLLFPPPDLNPTISNSERHTPTPTPAHVPSSQKKKGEEKNNNVDPEAEARRWMHQEMAKRCRVLKELRKKRLKRVEMKVSEYISGGEHVAAERLMGFQIDLEPDPKKKKTISQLMGAIKAYEATARKGTQANPLSSHLRPAPPPPLTPNKLGNLSSGLVVPPRNPTAKMLADRARQALQQANVDSAVRFLAFAAFEDQGNNLYFDKIQAVAAGRERRMCVRWPPNDAKDSKDPVEAIEAEIDSRSNRLLELQINKLNGVSGLRARAMLRGIAFCSVLECISLSGSMLGDEVVVPIAELLVSQGCALRFLDLTKNNLTPIGAKKLSGALTDNGSLETLCLNNNRLGMQGVAGLAKCLQTNVTLRSVKMSQCGLHDFGVELLLESLRFNSTLTDLALDYNFETSEKCLNEINKKMKDRRKKHVIRKAPPGLPPVARGLLPIEPGSGSAVSVSEIYEQAAKELESMVVTGMNDVLTIDASGSLLPGRHLSRTLMLIPRCGHLVELRLPGNAIGEAAGLWIANCIELHPSLKHLDLSNNRLTSFAATELGKSLKYNVTLTNLSLAGNVLIGDGGAVAIAQGVRAAFSPLESKKSENTLDRKLDGTGVEKEDKKSLEVKRSASKLICLDLSDCDITDNGCRMLVKLLREQTPLVQLGFSKNPGISSVFQVKLRQAIRHNRLNTISPDAKFHSNILTIAQNMAQRQYLSLFHDQTTQLLRELANLSPRWNSLRRTSCKTATNDIQRISDIPSSPLQQKEDSQDTLGNFLDEIADFSVVKKRFSWSQGRDQHWTFQEIGRRGSKFSGIEVGLSELLVAYLLALPRHLQSVLIALGEEDDTKGGEFEEAGPFHTKQEERKANPGDLIGYKTICTVDAYVSVLGKTKDLHSLNLLALELVDVKAQKLIDQTRKRKRDANIEGLRVDAGYERLERAALFIQRVNEYLEGFSLVTSNKGSSESMYALPRSALDMSRSMSRRCIEALGRVIRRIVLENAQFCIQVAEADPPELIGTLATVDKEDRLAECDRLLPDLPLGNSNRNLREGLEKKVGIDLKNKVISARQKGDSSGVEKEEVKSGVRLVLDKHDSGKVKGNAPIGRFFRLMERMNTNKAGESEELRYKELASSLLHPGSEGYGSGLALGKLRSEVYGRLEVVVFNQFAEAFDSIQNELRVNLGMDIKREVRQNGTGQGSRPESTPTTPTKKSRLRGVSNSRTTNRGKVKVDDVVFKMKERVAMDAKEAGFDRGEYMELDLDDFLGDSQNKNSRISAMIDEDDYKVGGRTRLEIILAVLQKLVDELLLVCELVVPCFPPDYHIFRFFASRYNAFINQALTQNTVASRYATKKPPRAVLLKALKWVKWYTGELKGLFRVHGRYYADGGEKTVVPLLTSWETVRLSLMSDWITQMQENLCGIVHRIASRGPLAEIVQRRMRSLSDAIIHVSPEEDKKEDTKESYMEVATHNPLDLFSTLYAMIGPPLAPPGLDAHEVLQLTETLAFALELFQREQRLWLTQAVVGIDQSILVNGKSLEDKSLLAVLNDARRLQRLSERLFRKRLLPLAAVGSDAVPPTRRLMITKRCEKCCMQFQVDAALARRLIEGVIVCSMFDPLDQLARLTLTTSLNLENRRIALSALTATLDDFFADYGRKLHSSIFLRLLRDTLRATACEYLRAFVRLAKGRPQSAADAKRVGDYIRLDLKEIGEFVGALSRRFPDIYIPKSIVNADFTPILVVVSVMDAASIEDLQEQKASFQRTLRMLKDSEEIMKVIDCSETDGDDETFTKGGLKAIKKRVKAAKQSESINEGRRKGGRDKDEENVTRDQVKFISSLLMLRKEFKSSARKKFMKLFRAF
ncbi:hypothetical protein AAMO2058_000273100 [Amorphochlora amoebiformis]